MTCTRTGAQIFLWQYGVYAYCDAFEIIHDLDAADYFRVAYFRIVDTSFAPFDDQPNLHFIVREVENWFKDHPTQTLITKAGGYENLGYEGRPVAEVIRP